MTTRIHSFVEDEYYHIYNRGNSKQLIFLDEQDYKVFQYFLYLMNMEERVASRDVGDDPYSYFRNKELVSVGAYCLMPNHFHILVTQKEEKGISKFMLKLSTAYSMYFNKKYKHRGSLYEGVFKSKHVNNDIYLKYLYAYIHLNPLKLMNSNWKNDLILGKKINEKDFKYVLEYPYSSVSFYKGKDLDENKILDISSFPYYFLNTSSFVKDLTSWVTLGEYLK